MFYAESTSSVQDKRYIFVGCEEVPGFEAVALGQKVDVTLLQGK